MYLGIPIVSREKVIIKSVRTSVREIDHDTLIFHLQKTDIINIKKLLSCRNCFIITDQALLKPYKEAENRFIFVRDVTKAYNKFIDFYHALLKVKTIAITGTCGKSTTKEMIKQILSRKHKTTGTIGSRNSLRYNHNYLIEIDGDTEYGVYETALTDPGQIIYTANFFKPSIGVITNIGIDHLSGCRSLENYILAKSEMLTALGNRGTLIINSDCENTRKIDFSLYKGKIITFGIKNKAHNYAENITFKNGKMEFLYNSKYLVTIPGLGIHNVYNALAALSVLSELNFDIEEAIIGLKEFQPMKSHFEVHNALNHAVIIDDTFSSNPTSVKAALETLSLVKGTKVLVIGQISYLGNYALEQAREIGKMVVNNQIDYLITLDSFSRHIANEAIRQGMNENNIFNCRSYDELDTVLYNILEPNVYVLFKTSMFDRKINQTINKFIID